MVVVVMVVVVVVVEVSDCVVAGGCVKITVARLPGLVLFCV